MRLIDEAHFSALVLRQPGQPQAGSAANGLRGLTALCPQEMREKRNVERQYHQQ